MKKIDLDRIVDDFEEKNQKIKMAKYKKIIDEYSQICNMDFREALKGQVHDDYEVFDALLQITTVKSQFFNEFYDVLSRNGVDPRLYIDYAVKKVANKRSNSEAFIEGLSSVGMVQKLSKNKNDKSTHLTTPLGEYTFYSADEYFSNNPEVVSYIKHGNTVQNCHRNALFLLKSLKQGEAVTVKCQTFFNTEYYHSYYRLNGMICDLNTNCVMNENEYNRIYSPKIISVVNIENFEDKRRKAKENTTSTLVDLLEIAAYEEAMSMDFTDI